MSMQYGHCVVSATATAISSLYFTGMAPSATAALSKAQKASITCGARPFIVFSLARLSLVYMRLMSFCQNERGFFLFPGQEPLFLPRGGGVVRVGDRSVGSSAVDQD